MSQFVARAIIFRDCNELSRGEIVRSRHCEERSDEAIHVSFKRVDCFAPLAMTTEREQRLRLSDLTTGWSTREGTQ